MTIHLFYCGYQSNPVMAKGMQLTYTVAEAEFRKKLNRMDCGSIAVKLMEPDDKVGWTLEQTTAAIEDYRRFLLLNYLYPDRIIDRCGSLFESPTYFVIRFDEFNCNRSAIH